MPTLAGDVQAVLADEKVLFQGQEVAFVIAEDRYIAADAVDLSRSITKSCRPSSIRSSQWTRTRLFCATTSKTKRVARTARASTTTTSLPGRSATPRDRRAPWRKPRWSPRSRSVYQRVHPCPLETCGCVASMDKVNGHLTVWGTFQAPHAVRTVASLISGIPEHKIRIISPDIGGGFGNKVGVYPGYICAIVASIVTRRAGQMDRGPDREPAGDRLRPRLSHDRRDRGDQDGRITGSALPCARRSRRVRRLRRPDQVPGRLLQHLHRFL